MKQHKFINLLKEDEAALKKAENKIRKELKRRETTIVKSISRDVEKKNPTEKDIIQWLKDDAAMWVSGMVPSDKYSADWRAFQERFNKIYREFADETYKKYFKNRKVNENFEFVDLLNEGNSLPPMAQKIVDFVERKSYFNYDDHDSNKVWFNTRQNGNVGSEKAGKEDIKEAQRLKKLLMKQFSVQVELEVVDEWVFIHVDFSGPKQEKFEYRLIKHDISNWTSLNSTGFTHIYDDYKKLIPDVAHWCNMAKSEASKYIQKLDKMKINKHYYGGDYADINLGNCGWDNYQWTIAKVKPNF